LAGALRVPSHDRDPRRGREGLRDLSGVALLDAEGEVLGERSRRRLDVAAVDRDRPKVVEGPGDLLGVAQRAEAGQALV
jgi:hypothetical protein